MANPQQALEKWKRNTAQAGQSMKDGVANVTVSPGVRANAVKDKYIRRVTEAFNDGSYEAGNNSYTTEDWKRAMVEKGVPNAANGVAKMSARSAANITAAINQANAIKATCDNMPKNSDAEALEKVRTAMDMWKQYKKNRAR